MACAYEFQNEPSQVTIAVLVHFVNGAKVTGKTWFISPPLQPHNLCRILFYTVRIPLHYGLCLMVTDISAILSVPNKNKQKERKKWMLTTLPYSEERKKKNFWQLATIRFYRLLFSPAFHFFLNSFWNSDVIPDIVQLIEPLLCRFYI